MSILDEESPHPAEVDRPKEILHIYVLHAYRDKVYRLIDCFLGTNENLKEKRIGDFHNKVRTALGDRGLKRAVAGPPPGLTGEAALLRRRPPPRRWR